MIALGLAVTLLAQVPPVPVISLPLPAGWLAEDAEARLLSTFPSDAGTLVSSAFEARPDDGGSWAAANVVHSGPLAGSVRWAPGPFINPIHLDRWCLRARWSNAAGPSAWTADRCFTFDVIDPTPPAVLTTAQNGGRVALAFTPSSDADSQIDGYWIIWGNPANPPFYGSSFSHGFTSSSPAVALLGPGTWALRLQVRDQAINYSSQVGAEPVTVTFTSNVLPTPAAPTISISRNSNLDLRWTPGLSHTTFRYRFLELNGSWSDWSPLDTFGPGVSQRTFSIGRARPGEIQAAQVNDAGDVSDWSPSSALGGWDDADPQLTSTTVIGGVEQLSASWTASDTWSGVDHFEYELLQEDGGAWLSGQSAAIRVAADAGTYVVRARAVDLAGRGSAWSEELATVLPSTSGATDAGAPDGGGAVDAGSLDAGANEVDGGGGLRSLDVGCGCGAEPGLAPLLLLLSAMSRRRRFSGG